MYTHVRVCVRVYVCVTVIMGFSVSELSTSFIAFYGFAGFLLSGRTSVLPLGSWHIRHVCAGMSPLPSSAHPEGYDYDIVQR